MPAGAIEAAVLIALIIAFTIYNIWRVRKSTRLWREIEKQLKDKRD
jgi:hypothetical protein